MHLRIEMGMPIDEAWDDDMPVRIDFPHRGTGDLADCGDKTLFYCHISTKDPNATLIFDLNALHCNGSRKILKDYLHKSTTID